VPRANRVELAPIQAWSERSLVTRRLLPAREGAGSEPPAIDMRCGKRRPRPAQAAPIARTIAAWAAAAAIRLTCRADTNLLSCSERASAKISVE